MPARKVDHKNTICCVCRSNRTRVKWLDLEGKEIYDWRKHICNKKDCTGYVCYYCYTVGSTRHEEYMYEKRKSAQHFKGRKCSRCGKAETFIDSKGTPRWDRKYDKDGNWTGEYLCHNCGGINYYKENLSIYRSEGILIDNSQGIGMIGEAIVAKVRKLEVLSIKMDNFSYKFDLSYDIEYRIIQVKTKSPYYGDYKIDIGMEHNFHNVFILCISKDKKNIDDVYIIPEDELYGIVNITIIGNPKLSIGSKWGIFKVNEEIKNIYNDTYHSLLLFLGDKKYFGIDDIKKWMEL